jgi:peptide chain release factor 2
MKEKNQLERMISRYLDLETETKNQLELAELGELEGDESIVLEAETSLKRITSELKQMETDSLLSGEADANNCFLEVNSGAGGTESMDWCAILLRMYMRWAEKRGFKCDLLEETLGEEAGIKSATIKISGHNAYGWAKTETGVHRLVRISPFDSNARRHTSFASVWVTPEIDDSIVIELNDKDLQVDTMRSGGAGGQHVNKTESAVRITHLPTGIAAKSQSSRSQHANRAEALQMLKAKLYERELREREAKAQVTEDAKSDVAWGHQIRSYVLHPYQMIKDLRTEVETSDSQGVLDGNLDAFMAAALAERIQGK